MSSSATRKESCESGILNQFEKVTCLTSLTSTTQEKAIKITFGKRFVIPLDFNFFQHLVYPYGLKQG